MYPGVRREGGLRNVPCRRKGARRREAADAMTSRRGRLAVGIVLSAVTVLLAMNGPNLWRWATTKKIPLGATMPSGRDPWGGVSEVSINSDVVRGWKTVKRWSYSATYHGKGIGYWVDTGFKRIEFELETGSPSAWSIGRRRESSSFNSPSTSPATGVTDPPLPGSRGSPTRPNQPLPGGVRKGSESGVASVLLLSGSGTIGADWSRSPHRSERL